MVSVHALALLVLLPTTAVSQGKANQPIAQATESSRKWRGQQGQVAIDWPLLLGGSPAPHEGTIQALLRLGGSEQQIPFTQLGFNRYANGRNITLGLGHRWQNSPEISWGLNLFYDHQLKECHQRASIGIERHQALLKLATNVYLPLSRYCTVNNSTTDTVRPASGLDVLIDSTLSHYPWLGFKVLCEYYAGTTGMVLAPQGFKALPYPAVTLGVHYTPIPLLTLSYDYTIDKQQRHTYQVELRLSYRFDHSPSEQLQSEQIRRLCAGGDSQLALVARHNRIVLQKDTPHMGNNLSTPGSGSTIFNELEQKINKCKRFLVYVHAKKLRSPEDTKLMFLVLKNYYQSKTIDSLQGKPYPSTERRQSFLNSMLSKYNLSREWDQFQRQNP